jgi:hypothetical protein
MQALGQSVAAPTGDPAYSERHEDAMETAAITHAVRYRMPVLSCSLG